MHRSGLVKLAAFIVGDQATGEDVVQDVFARLHQRWDMLADPDDPLPYVRTAVVNGCRSAIRRRGRAQRHAGHDSPSPPLSTEESVLLSEDRQQVLAALAGLSRRRREVLVLRFYLTGYRAWRGPGLFLVARVGRAGYRPCRARS